MDVIVRGNNVPVPSTLRSQARRKLARVERMARDVAWAEVDFSEERNPRIRERHRCAVVVHRRHQFVAAHAAAPDPAAALERALDKIRHQVDQRKERR
jgi:ribosomal subunit interface protein